MNVEKYWNDVLNQDADAIRNWFSSDARIRWHNTNEEFTVDEFIRANCEYPGSWGGKIENIVRLEHQIITTVCVYSKNGEVYFHVVSFLELKNDKICFIDEYWGEDGPAPQWRKDLHIGRNIVKRREYGTYTPGIGGCSGDQ